MCWGQEGATARRFCGGEWIFLRVGLGSLWRPLSGGNNIMIDILNNPSGGSGEDRGSQTRVGTGNQCGGHGDDGGGMEVAWTTADLGDRGRRCILDILRRQNSLMG